MLEQFIYHRIVEQLPFQANQGQEELLHKIADFIVKNSPRKAFILRGYAGTGKTSIMAALVQALKDLKQRIVLLAPTGRAAKVLSRYAHHNAYTIHKYIYRQKQLGEECFSLNDNLHPNTLFIVDEASMISGKKEYSNFGSGMLLDDLVKFVYSAPGCSLMMLGDNAQLPPVGSLDSPALNEDYMAGYELQIYAHTLTEVARQALDSGILENATRLRPLALGEEARGERRKARGEEARGEEARGEEARGERRKARGEEARGEEAMWDIVELGRDVQTVSGAELLEILEQSYNEVGEEETIMLTRTNRRTNIYNQGIRARILWREDEISTGDRVMVSKNNYFWTEKYENLPFLANGDLLEIVRLRNIREMYGYHFADAQLKALDYDWEIDAIVWLDTLNSDGPEVNTKMHKALFEKIAEDYPELIHSRRKLVEKIYESPYYNALQIRMAYAITGHKSQGGQWARVIIDPYKGGDTSTPQTAEERQEFYRWLYTAITRATEKVYLIKNK